jgi:hypothetical protein
MQQLVTGLLLVVEIQLNMFRADRTDHDQQHCYHHVPTVNQSAAAVDRLLMMGKRMPETC